MIDDYGNTLNKSNLFSFATLKIYIDYIDTQLQNYTYFIVYLSYTYIICMYVRGFY